MNNTKHTLSNGSAVYPILEDLNAGHIYKEWLDFIELDVKAQLGWSDCELVELVHPLDPLSSDIWIYNKDRLHSDFGLLEKGIIKISFKTFLRSKKLEQLGF
ncbi:MAG: hypothetical protein EBU08_03720 [Micrococcales bacterium]|nr:hypothetical protein [Micrococcales bacterium]